MHALTGCNTVSCIFCTGKAKAYKHAKSLKPINLKPLANLSNLCANEALTLATKFIAPVYDTNWEFEESYSCINTFRVLLAKEKYTAIKRIPPSKPAILEHVIRTSWQSHQWVNADQSKIVYRRTAENGWTIDKSGLHYEYYKEPTDSCQCLTPYQLHLKNVIKNKQKFEKI